MKNTKNKKNMIKKADNMEYDMSKDQLFSASVSLGPNCPAQSIRSVKIDKLDHDGNMTFDDVSFAVDEEIEKTFPEKSYPDIKILEYLVFGSDTEKWYPVVSESDKASIKRLKTSKKYDRFLVLPDATYHLTPEAEIWMTLRDQGLIAEDSEFNFDEMHKILEIANKKNDKNGR